MLLRNLEEFEIPYTETILGFSDTLLASRALYTQAESHRLSAMLWEVGLPVRWGRTSHYACAILWLKLVF